MLSALFGLVILGSCISSTKSFAPARKGFQVVSLRLSANPEHFVEVVSGESRVLDVASFRNGIVNPEMMVKRAQEKRDAIDTTEAAINGVKIGLLLVGPIAAISTYLDSNDFVRAATNYVNNYMGKGVHVPDIPEATNRIIVDFSEGLLRKQDIGFVAVCSDPFFSPTRGVMGAVDVQLRNSEKSHPGVRKVPNLPSHLHIKNMEVHKTMRRRGVGEALLDEIVSYAKNSTDAEALTLEVEAANPAAVNLYRKTGFVVRENPNKLSKNLFMIKEL